MEPSVQIELLRRMKRIRMVEEAIAERYCQWKMRCPTHLCVGQEAVGAALGMVLRTDDLAVSTHRSHGHYLGKGGDLAAMLAEIHGKAAGCSSGKGGSMHLIDRSVGFVGSTAIVGGTIPVGVGLALGFRIRGTDQVSCVFLGDGSVEEGVFYESVNFAALKQLPVLFVCENNFFSVYSPLRVRQPAGRSICEMVRAIGVSSDAGDGNDAAGVYRMAASAVEGIRKGEGPRFLEFFTYRWREHCGPNYDNDLGYRSQEEFDDWKAKEPIRRLQARLVDRGLLAPEAVERMESAIAEEIDSAFRFTETSPFPSPEEAFTQLYKE